MDSFTLRQVNSPKRLMMVFPHPDDESFGPGGTIARYAAEGAAVHFVCATRGEAGTVKPELLKSVEHLPEDERLGTLRETELRCASAQLGLTGLHFLGYRDSGMTPTADPRAFVNANPDEVVGALVQLIRQIRPQVLVTFDPFGGYGHPDHIFIHHRTTEAFYTAADPKRYPEAGAPYQPQKLYWSTFPKRWLKIVLRLMALLGKDPSKFGRNGDIDLRQMAAYDYPVTTKIDIWPYYSIKADASACHVSQDGSAMQLKGWPNAARRRIIGYELFTRVEPALNGRRDIESDLFEGVNE
jgi:LmbE family N-acetylglucosaminyl deacetylase